jgi:hypothetical protein
MRIGGVTSGSQIFKSLDDYSAPIPWEDLVRYGVILAHRQDRQRLNNRRWGPLWTIYPRDQIPAALKGPIAESRSRAVAESRNRGSSGKSTGSKRAVE